MLGQGFFSVHGESAVEIARKFYRTTAAVRTIGDAATGLQGTSWT